MAENKQYITQHQDNGSILISEEVIATIIANAVKDVDGVVSLTAKPGVEIAEMIVKKTLNKGIKIVIGENNELHVDCNITIAYGQSVIDVAKAAQAAVINALESMAAVKVAGVNMNVCGIVRQ